MSFTVRLVPAAKEDLFEILDWINQRSPAGAASWFYAWKQALHSLEVNPPLRLAPENEDHPLEIRQLLFKTRRGNIYRALFTIRDNEVVVLRVRGPGQNILSADEIDPSDALESD